jgi:uncharacterized membrane protein YjgN (DUF898 family)
MTATHAPGIATATPLAAPRRQDDQPAAGGVQFLGRERDYWLLIARGAALLMVTLGIYRFWLVTDIRRYLWPNTEVAGHTFEYNGTAVERLVGFLIAIAILLPINVAFFVAAFGFGELSVSAFLSLVALSQFAVYRARRYRLTRTVYRGIRFHQTGSALNYAARAFAWWIAFVLTFGLTYPWAKANLERFKLKNTYYGNLPGRFEGVALPLFLRGLAMWLIVMGPLMASVVAALSVVDWPGVMAIPPRRITDADLSMTGLARGAVLIASGLGWAVAAAASLYPAFHAMTLRWWLSGLRLGPIEAVSHLQIGQVYRAYLRFLRYAGTFAGVAVTLLFLGFASLGLIMIWLFPDLWTRTTTGSALAAETMGVIAVIGSYVFTVLGLTAIYQVVVKLGLWRLGAETLALSNADALANVKAAGRPASPVGEGLADALHVGGF